MRLLRANAKQVSNATLEATVEQAKAAESAWRSAKPKAPLNVRVGWARKKFANALDLQARHQKELDDFEAQVAADRERLAKRAAEDRERVALHQRKLDDLRAEMDGDDDGALPQTQSLSNSLRIVRRGFEDVLPALLKLANGLPSESGHKEEARQILSQASALQDILAQGKVDDCQEHYDIGDYWDEDGDYHDDCDLGDDLGGELDDEWADQIMVEPTAPVEGQKVRWNKRGAGDQSWGAATWRCEGRRPRTAQAGGGGDTGGGSGAASSTAAGAAAASTNPTTAIPLPPPPLPRSRWAPSPTPFLPRPLSHRSPTTWQAGKQYTCNRRTRLRWRPSIGQRTARQPQRSMSSSRPPSPRSRPRRTTMQSSTSSRGPGAQEWTPTPKTLAWPLR